MPCVHCHECREQRDPDTWPSNLGLAYVLLVEINPSPELVVFFGLFTSNIPRYFLDFAFISLSFGILSIPLIFVSHYSAFFTVSGTNTNVLNCLKPSGLSNIRGGLQDNVTRTIEKWTRMQEDYDTNHNSSLFISHFFSTIVTMETRHTHLAC